MTKDQFLSKWHDLLFSYTNVEDMVEFDADFESAARDIVVQATRYRLPIDDLKDDEWTSFWKYYASS